MTDTNSDPFRGPKLKIERAKRHIGDYRLALKSFSESDPMQIRPEFDSDTRKILFRAYWLKPTPGDLSLITADTLYNLRSALDQAVCCCARAAGKSPKNTYFPHGLDKEGFEASLEEKCKKVPKPIRRAIASLEPYYGGNGYLLRALHDLNIVDKHSDLLSVALSVQGVIVEKDVPPGGGVVWESHEEKLEIIDATNLTKVDENIKISLAITFTDVEAVRGRPVMQILHQSTDLVTHTVGILETAISDWLIEHSPNSRATGLSSS